MPRARHAIWFIERHLEAGLILLLTIAGAVVYGPSLLAYFVSDDFQYVGYLFFTKNILNPDVLRFWFIEGMDGGLYFRPVGHAFMLVDYIIWGTNPLGYHLTNIIFHLLATVEVLFLTELLVRKRLAAVLAATLFLVLPVHAGAVSWIAARYDVIAGFFYLAALIFFVLYRQRIALRYYGISLAALALALGSKETALSFPVVVLLYDLLFNRKSVLRLRSLAVHIPFWMLLLGRFYFFGHGYRNFQLIPEGIGYWLDWNLSNLLQPFVGNPSMVLRWSFVAAVPLLIIFYRFRAEISWPILLIPMAMAATLTSGPSDRSLYIPSIGLAMVLGIVFASLINGHYSPVRWASLASFVLLLLVLATTLFSLNQAYNRAGAVAQSIPEQVKSLHPELPADAILAFVGVPDQIPEGPLVYISGFGRAVQMAYGSQLQVLKFEKFPIWLDRIDQMYFFQVDHRRVSERSDLVQALVERKGCSADSRPALKWDFTDTQGWEPWNDLEGFESKGGVLVARSVGNDPFMGSPSVDIPSLAVGELQVTMSVSTNKPAANGSVYWLVAGQEDFSPGMQVSFPVQRDGQFHSYAVDLVKSNRLALGDRITRFRLDPVDTPADIAIKSIVVTTQCNSLEGERCECIK